MMNERIFELAKQADLIEWDTLPSGARTPDHESVAKAIKFAKAIVRECAQFVEDKFDFIGDEIIVKEKMLAHFGVEND
jgi:hypothetical protein